jgi:hypothetical protein
MSRDLTDAAQAKLLARAQKLKDAELDDFGEEASEHWNGRQAGSSALAPTSISASSSSTLASPRSFSAARAAGRGSSRYGPTVTLPRYVPRERARAGERARPVRERSSMGALSPKNVMKYIRTRKEAWRVEARRAVADEFADIAPTVNKLGFDRVRQYIDRVAGVSGSDGWRRHLRDQFGEAIVEFFGAEIDGTGVR